MSAPAAPPIRWGILSTANIGRAAVIPAIQASGNGDVVAVASRAAERAEQFASANSIPGSYASYDALLDANRTEREVDEDDPKEDGHVA